MPIYQIGAQAHRGYIFVKSAWLQSCPFEKMCLLDIYYLPGSSLLAINTQVKYVTARPFHV